MSKALWYDRLVLSGSKQYARGYCWQFLNACSYCKYLVKERRARSKCSIDIQSFGFSKHFDVLFGSKDNNLVILTIFAEQEWSTIDCFSPLSLEMDITSFSWKGWQPFSSASVKTSSDRLEGWFFPLYLC